MILILDPNDFELNLSFRFFRLSWAGKRACCNKLRCARPREDASHTSQNTGSNNNNKHTTQPVVQTGLKQLVPVISMAMFRLRADGRAKCLDAARLRWTCSTNNTIQGHVLNGKRHVPHNAPNVSRTQHGSYHAARQSFFSLGQNTTGMVCRISHVLSFLSIL